MLYDLTTLHFETDVEDRLRKVGMSKERRVDPQVTVGLLTTGTGFPLDVHLFEGNKAETKTLVPVLTGFAERHHIDDVVVVADAGMLSAANLVALEEAGFAFIVGSRPSSAADDLADHFRRHGNAFTDGQTIEATRTMGTGKHARDRRVVYEYKFKRSQHDNRAINKMIERAEAVAAGTRPLKKDRFVKITDAVKGVDWDLVERARYLAGLKGYVTNIDPATMDGPARRGRLPRPLPGRTVLPDDQVRPRRAADVPPDPRQHRSPPDHRVRRARGLPRGPSPDRSQHQEDRSDPTTVADRHHQPRQPDRSPPHRASPTTPKPSSTTSPRVVTKPIQLRSEVQTLATLRSRYPLLRSVEAMAMTIPLFIVVFSTTHYLINGLDPASYSEPMTRFDALYFTMTTFATVGFGDITPVSLPARFVTLLQIIGGLILVGVVARVLISAARFRQDRRSSNQTSVP